MKAKAAAVVAVALLGVAAVAQLEQLTKPQEGKSMRASSAFREGKDGKYDPKAPYKGDLFERSNSDNFRVAPGAIHTLMDVKGPGEITHIWMTFLGPERHEWAPQGSATHQDMLLRIYWDGNPKPAVEAPVGDFFANCFGQRSSVISLPVMVEDADSYNCFWRMPFKKGARVEIINQGTKPVNLLYYNIDWLKKDRLPKDTPYFYAQYRQEYPVKKGEDYVLLDTKGKGHVVGTVLGVRSRSPSWFGEGDEKIYIDGEAQALIWGTGTEDYFLSAWGLKTVSTPYSGTPFFDGWGLLGGRTSAYRWHINDPIVFQKGIRMTMEHFGWISKDENRENRDMSWNEREDDFSSVTFWYQTGTPTFTARAPSAAERRLPSLDLTTYARDAATHGPGNAEKQSLGFYEGDQLLYMPSKAEGSYLEIPFEVKTKEPRRLLLNLTKSYDFGIYKVTLNGIPVGGPIDLYSAEVANAEVPLLDFWPEPGKYTIRLECVGKNERSTGHYLGIESVRLRERRPRVKEMGWDKDKDWKKNPVLYG